PPDPSFHSLASTFRHTSALTHAIILLVLRSLESELDSAENPQPSVLTSPDQKATIASVVFACAASLGDPGNRWCDQAGREKAADVLAGVAAQLTGVEVKHPASAEDDSHGSPSRSRERHGHKISEPHHVLEYILGDILELEIKPLFGKRGSKFDDEESQRWREERPECVAALEWCIGQVKNPYLHEHLPTLLPPLLTLLDSHQPTTKLSALRSLSHVLLNTPANALHSLNVPQLVLEPALTASTYYDHPALVTAAINAATSAVLVGEPKYSETYYAGLERVLRDGVLRGLHFTTGSKPGPAIAAVLDPAPRLLELASPFTVRHMSALLEALGRVVEIHSRDPQVMDGVSHTLHSLCRACEPRVASWSGQILSVAGSGWVGFKKAMKSQASRTQDSRAADAMHTVEKELKAAVSIVRESVARESKALEGSEGEEMRSRLDADLRVLREIHASELIDKA
ncbi:hypothetical protein HDU93_003723, partial [Gonapodya sp. JEL0774]